MSRTKSLYLLAGASLGLGSVSAALAGEPVAPADRDEIRSIVAEMLSDAETRSSLLQGGGTAGYDKHFFLASSDNNYRLNISGYMQIRYNAYYNGSSDTEGSDINSQNNYQAGFEMARTRLIFDGHVVNPNLKFYIEGGFDNRTAKAWDSADDPENANQMHGGAFELYDAYVSYEWGNGWWIRGGQFKLPFMRDSNVAAQYQLCVERGIVEEAFGLGRSQGLELGWRDDHWAFSVMGSDGARADNSAWNDTFLTNTADSGDGFGDGKQSDWAFTLHAAYNSNGGWDRWKDFTSKQDEDWAWMVGVGGHIQGAPNVKFFGADGSDNSDALMIAYTADINVKGQGFNLMGEFVGIHTDYQNSLNVKRDDFGWAIQAGYRLTKDDEIFARYDGLYADHDDNADNGSADVSRSSLDKHQWNFLTVGYNHYFAGHAAKFTADAIMAFERTDQLEQTQFVTIGGRSELEGVDDPNNVPNTFDPVLVGLIPTSKSFSIGIRLQFQLMF